MTTPKKQYVREMREKFGYFATWHPALKLQLGDVGVLRDQEFIRESSLRDFGITFDIQPGGENASLSYESPRSVQVTFKPAGSALVGSSLGLKEAGAVVEFQREAAVVFKATGCRTHSIANQFALGQEILQRYRDGRWDKRRVIITELVTVRSATILISSTGGAKAELRVVGKVGVAAQSLAEVSSQLELAAARDVELKVVGQGELTPLFRASGVKPSLFGDAAFLHRGQDEAPEEVADVVFAQLEEADLG